MEVVLCFLPTTHYPVYDFDLRATHACTLLPAALASVSFGCVLIRLHALRNLALYCPVVTQNLRRTPLFTYSANAEPLGYDFLAQTLTALLPSIIPLDAASNNTWHSSLIGLACALRSAQAPGWVLLALQRWRSPSSIPVYGRISFESAASWLNQASGQEAASTQATNLPSMTSTLEHSTLPNALSSEAYSYLDRAWTQPLPTSDVSGLQALLPQSDDDNFVAEMSNSEVAPSLQGSYGEASEPYIILLSSACHQQRLSSLTGEIHPT